MSTPPENGFKEINFFLSMEIPENITLMLFYSLEFLEDSKRK